MNHCSMNLVLGISVLFSGEHVSPVIRRVPVASQWLQPSQICKIVCVFTYVLTHILMPVFTSSAFRKSRNV